MPSSPAENPGPPLLRYRQSLWNDVDSASRNPPASLSRTTTWCRRQTLRVRSVPIPQPVEFLNSTRLRNTEAEEESPPDCKPEAGARQAVVMVALSLFPSSVKSSKVKVGLPLRFSWMRLWRVAPSVAWMRVTPTPAPVILTRSGPEWTLPRTAGASNQ